MSKQEISLVPLKEGVYKKPERVNPNIPDRKYDKVDESCESSKIANDGNAYIEDTMMPGLLGKRKNEARYIVDNKIPDKDKVRIDNRNMINTAGVVGYLDQNSHQTRNVEEADLNRYARDSLIRIGDSDQAEAIRRKIDEQVNKELPKLKQLRGTTIDEITGEPLVEQAQFHHLDNKSISNHPFDVIDPDQGINVNADTHKEIHRRGIMDRKQLEEQTESIREAVKKTKNKEN